MLLATIPQETGGDHFCHRKEGNRACLHGVGGKQKSLQWPWLIGCGGTACYQAGSGSPLLLALHTYPFFPLLCMRGEGGLRRLLLGKRRRRRRGKKTDLERRNQYFRASSLPFPPSPTTLTLFCSRKKKATQFRWHLLKNFQHFGTIPPSFAYGFFSGIMVPTTAQWSFPLEPSEHHCLQKVQTAPSHHRVYIVPYAASALCFPFSSSSTSAAAAI